MEKPCGGRAAMTSLHTEHSDGGAATLLLGIPAGLLLCEAKASAVANRAPIPLGG